MLDSVIGGIFGLARDSLNNGFNALAAKQQFQYNKQLMQDQYGYNSQLMSQQQDFNRTNMQQQSQFNMQLAQQAAELDDQYQRQLLADSPAIQANALRKAGISLASMNGGFSPVSSNVSSSPQVAQPSASGQSVGLPSSGLPSYDFKFLEALKSIKELHLMDAQVHKTKSEADKNDKEVSWMDDEKQASIYKTIKDGDYAKENIEKTKKEVDYVISRTKLTDEQKSQTKAATDKIFAEIEGIKINNSLIEKLTNAQIDNLLAQADKAGAEKDSVEIRNTFARLGIGISDDFFTTLLAMSAQGANGKVVNQVIDGLGDAIKTIYEKFFKSEKDEDKPGLPGLHDAYELGDKLGEALFNYIKSYMAKQKKK